ncbi:MAG: M6 family metalloprotease domain-containing protein [Paludibacteraceae bacterium]|nr:M6 family metalloprotease domain-containing protein [Paludibacteraceae bacterium]
MKKTLLSAILVVVSTSVMAVPAKRGAFVRTAADGTEKTVYLNGDEHFHYITDAEGNWLDEETLTPIPAEIKAARQEAGEARVAAAREMQRQRAQVRRAKQETGLTPLLSPRGAVILVSYKDKAFKSTNAQMTDWAMGDNYTYNGATGSIHKYFYDQSWGAYDLQIDVYGPVKVSQKLSYYGKNDSNGDDQHPDELVKEACILAHDSCGADFSQYDFDGDGKVDWVVILYAGYGEASGAAANTIWPHQWELSYSDMAFDLDGKTIDHYCCLNELTGTSGSRRDGIGTFCHEFSHVMGLPDLYATTDNATHRTMVDWDIMDYGPYNNDGNTPPNYSAYEKWFMGWITPTLVNSEASVIMPPLEDCRAAVLLTDSGVNVEDVLNPNPKKYYLLENRKQEGWDAYLPGEGLMITKINYNASRWVQNTVNNYSSSMGVDILEAKKNSNTYEGAATDLYPAGSTTFTTVKKFPVTNIALEDGIITFDVCGGGDTIELKYEAPQGIEEIVERVGEKTMKVLHNGQVLIIRNGVVYDLNGRMTTAL